MTIRFDLLLLLLVASATASAGPLVDVDDLAAWARRRVRCADPDGELEGLLDRLKSDPWNDSSGTRSTASA
jgi:hypothetical protein